LLVCTNCRVLSRNYYADSLAKIYFIDTGLVVM